MKVVLPVLILILVVSCSTTSDSNKDSIEDEFAGIENSDFLPQKEIDYIFAEDLYSEDIDDDSLLRESIARITTPKLDDIPTDKDPVGVMVRMCYQKRFDEAFSIFDKIYRKYKSNPSFWNQTGTCYYLQGNLRKALLFYNKSRDLNSKYSPPINNLGVIYQVKGEDQKALLAYKKASKASNFSLTPMFNIGQIYLKYNLIKKAKKIFKTLYGHNKKDVDVIHALAFCSMAEAKYERAVEYYQRLSLDRLQRKDVAVYYALALKLNGNQKEGVELLLKFDGIEDLPGHYRNIVHFIRN